MTRRGKEYIEGMSGLWCAGLGFGDEELVDAAAEQMRTLPYYHLFGAKGTESAIELAEKLKEIAPVPISKVFYTSSGSEANDTQVKLAWYMNNAMGRPNKKKIISPHQGLSWRDDHVGVAYRPALQPQGLGPAGGPGAAYGLPAFLSISARRARARRSSSQRMVQSLRDLIEREGPDTIAAMIAEPVMGAGGVIVPPKGYYPAIQAVAGRARHHHDRR